MARKEPDPPHELDPLKGGLKHNPFAALRAKAEAAGVPIAPAAAEARQGGARSCMPSSEPAPGSKQAASTASPAKSAAATPPAAKPAPSSATPSRSGPAAAAPRVTVRIERTGRGGKTVTIAEGPGLAGRPLEVLARELARGMGTGARVEGSAIVVQGDQRERLVDWLGARGFSAAVAGN